MNLFSAFAWLCILVGAGFGVWTAYRRGWAEPVWDIARGAGIGFGYFVLTMLLILTVLALGEWYRILPALPEREVLCVGLPLPPPGRACDGRGRATAGIDRRPARPLRLRDDLPDQPPRAADVGGPARRHAAPVPALSSVRPLATRPGRRSRLMQPSWYA